MEAVSVNLSRKWRSQNFDQIVGQDLAVRILKNSLYLGHYFPVYLFAGQRGCGKTSTARIFAAALNCHELVTFQQDPKKLSIPCLSCISCKAMQEGKHPDFIEIDAASYTGVDHMRNIIESSSLLPIMGRRRVYLIDEAHMLSKAAFNAALKILEEPPATALFILATTNPHKILDTVRSRCFQLFFTPIAYDSLRDHLRTICLKENISYDIDALDLIIRHTQGSARDALNVLEQVRFSSSMVNKNAVLKLLGHINDQHIVDIIKTTLYGSSSELLHMLSTLAIDQYSADFIWQRLMTLLRALIWLKHGINPKPLVSQDVTLHDMAQHCSLSDLYRMVEVLYEYEELFLKTPQQHALLEMVLLYICQKDKKKFDNNGGSAPCSLYVANVNDESSEIVTDEDENNNEHSLQQKNIDYSLQWQRFIESVSSLNDPLLYSLFKQAHFVKYDQLSKKIVLECTKDFVLFKESFYNSRSSWQSILKKLFFEEVELDIQFTAENIIDKNNKNSSQPVEFNKISSVVTKPKENIKASSTIYKKKVTFFDQKKEKICDVSDKNKWKVASMILQHFPGVVTEIRENK